MSAPELVHSGRVVLLIETLATMLISDSFVVVSNGRAP